MVTGPGAPPIATVDDLAGQEVFVRKASIYDESLTTLNEQLKARGKPAGGDRRGPRRARRRRRARDGQRRPRPDHHRGRLPGRVLEQGVHRASRCTPTSPCAPAADLAVAFRKENPKLREAVNTWIRKHGKGDAFRNTIERRYLENVKYAKNAAADAERQKFQAVVELFKKYGAQYNVDYLLMAAQGYQESTLDQNVKSPVGAIGVMQVMPATGKELNVGDITEIDANIHAGVKYMRFMMDQYFKDEPMDDLNKGLMTFASYNAGPGRLRQLRREAEKRGLDPNVWFGNVERVASERIGRETVTYVSNIYKYYIAYKLVMDQLERRDAAKAQGREGTVRTTLQEHRRISVSSVSYATWVIVAIGIATPVAAQSVNPGRGGVRVEGGRATDLHGRHDEGRHPREVHWTGGVRAGHELGHRREEHLGA